MHAPRPADHKQQGATCFANTGGRPGSGLNRCPCGRYASPSHPCRLCHPLRAAVAAVGRWRDVRACERLARERVRASERRIDARVRELTEGVMGGGWNGRLR